MFGLVLEFGIEIYPAYAGVNPDKYSPLRSFGQNVINNSEKLSLSRIVIGIELYSVFKEIPTTK